MAATGYVCTKRVSLGGITYNPGDRIPNSAVIPERVSSLKRQGYLSDNPLKEVSPDALKLVSDGKGKLLYLP